MELGDFGTLWMSIHSERSDKLEEVKANNIKRVTARFTLGKEFKQILSNTEFVKNGS